MAGATPSAETVMQPRALTVADAYAEALLGLVPDDAEAERLAEELDALADLLAKTEGLDALLVAQASPAAQDALVVRVFGGRCHERVEALLATMARNGRLRLLGLVARRFRRRLYARQGRAEVTVITAAELDRDQRRQLDAALTELAGARPVVRMRVDESLLGGVVVRIGDREYDGSLAGGLRRLRRHLRQRLTQPSRKQ